MQSTTHTAIDLSSFGILSLSGEGAKKLLQGQLTCNLDEITETETRLAAQCNPEGRVVSFFRLFQFQNQYHLFMPQSLLTLTKNTLQKYAIFYKTTLAINTTLKIVGYQGNVLPGFELPPTVDTATLNNNLLTIQVAHERYLLAGELPTLTPLAPSTYWNYLDVINGIPVIYPETSGKFLPHELNLPQLNAISFKKGCYTGQEIIARMEYRGKLKKHLYRTRSLTQPQRGADIYFQQQPCGYVVDYCNLNDNHYEILVIAPDAITPSLDPEGNTTLSLVTL